MNKMATSIVRKTLILILTPFLILACKKDDSEGSISTSPFHVVDDETIAIDGVINSNTLVAFNEIIKLNPNTKLLLFKEAPGSEDDETNLKVGRRLHELQLDTKVDVNGLIASGAVDLFLAGDNRTLGTGARVGVHSWSDGQNEATDFSRDSDEHQFFISYYKDIGMSQQQAESFYFFTIHAAPAADVHWMTPEELETYQIETE